MNRFELEDYRDFAKNLALEAGYIANEYFEHTVEYTSKYDGSPVTEADVAINDLVIEKVEERYPMHKIIGEEGCGGNESGDIAWVCDPIDGTRLFTWGLPLSLFSLGITIDGQPSVGIVYDFNLNRMYSAIKNSGTWMEDMGSSHKRPVELNVSLDDQLHGGYGNLTGYKDFSDVDPYDILDELSGRGTGARMLDFNGVVYHGLMVAKGAWNFSVSGLKGAHDSAATTLLVQEAGGKATDIDGNIQRYDEPVNGSILSNGILHDEILEKIANARIRH